MVGPDRSGMVRFDELRRALELVGELRELPHGSNLQRMHALEGLCSLVDAQVGLWLRCTFDDTRRVVVRSALDRGWSSPIERQVFLRFLAGDQERAIDP